jgi:hypothetical protein
MTTVATVKTLTAEVRVLMVGNRQVTLSVYRQLDIVEQDDIEPFGRVNDSKDRGLWVVGRSSSGDLVRAKAVPLYADPLLWGFDMPVGALEIGAQAMRRELAGDRETTEYRVGHITIDGCSVRFGVNKNYPLHEDETRLRCADGWQPEVDRLAREVVSERAKSKAIYKRLRDLPLIVLAGLR